MIARSVVEEGFPGVLVDDIVADTVVVAVEVPGLAVGSDSTSSVPFAAKLP